MSKERMINSANVEGWLYSHKLEKRVSGATSKNPNTEYIRGTVNIATDDEMLNIVTVYYTYVTDSDKPAIHETFVNLANIENKIFKSVEDVGVENRDKATKLRLSPSIALNDFVARDTNEMASQKRNEGGFVRVVNSLNSSEDARATFRADMIITNVVHRDGDTERGYAPRADIHGYIFDFRKALLPVTFETSNEGAMRYFENLDASEENPVFTQVSGCQKTNVVTRTTTKESAFGPPIVNEISSTRKSFEINWAQPEEYMWDDPSTYTVAELKEAKQAREVHLADVRARDEEWRNRSGSAVGSAFATTAVAPTSTTKSNVEFDF